MFIIRDSVTSRVFLNFHIFSSACCFVGKAVISASLDGTVRAHDMLRYQNFRTMTTPTPVQLTSLAVDSSGELVCAGSLDPFQIFVWSLQTGRHPLFPTTTATHLSIQL